MQLHTNYTFYNVIVHLLHCPSVKIFTKNTLRMQKFVTFAVRKNTLPHAYAPDFDGGNDVI